MEREKINFISGMVAGFCLLGIGAIASLFSTLWGDIPIFGVIGAIFMLCGALFVLYLSARRKKESKVDQTASGGEGKNQQ